MEKPKVTSSTKEQNFKMQLASGAELDVDCSKEFLEKIKAHFELSSISDITNNHIKNFLFGSVKSALDRLE